MRLRPLQEEEKLQVPHNVTDRTYSRATSDVLSAIPTLCSGMENFMISNNNLELHNDNLKTIKNSNSDFNGSSFVSELLSPAGSKESFYAAINAGADAVYMGGSMFGARAFADNPDEKELLSLIDYAHLHNKKLFLTVNTLLKNEEIKVLYDYIKPYYMNGLDAVIVQDLGVLDFFKTYFPDLPVHISTQMTVTNTYLPHLLKESPNVSRIVTARELSLSEIKSIYDATGLEIESFVHGALCYSYSGQCLFSSIAGGRSGNRGRCAQPCRLPYQGSYPLSPKDLMTLRILPEILNAGVYSLKIEGRMKKPEYVASVISVYRHYLDLLNEKGVENYKVSEKDIDKLMDIYNRGNFTEGYYKEHNGAHMISKDRPNHTGVCVLKRQDNRYRVLKNISEGDVIEIDNNSFTVKKSVKAGKSTDLKELINANQGKKISQPQYIYRLRNNKLIEEITEKYISKNKKISVYGKVTAKLYEDLKFLLRYEIDKGNNKYNDADNDKKEIIKEISKEIIIEVTGPEVSLAQNRPVTTEDLCDKFGKIGNTPFEYGRLDIFADEDAFVNMKACNELRREAFEKLEKEILSKYKRSKDTSSYEESYEETLDKTYTVEYNKPNDEMQESHFENINKFNVLVSKNSQINAVINYKKYIENIYIDLNFYPFGGLDKAINFCKENDLKVYIGMPYIFRKNTEKVIDKYRESIEKADGYLLRTLEEYGYLQNHNLKNKDNIIFDYTIYDYNVFADKFLEKFSPKAKTLSLELDFHELKEFSPKNSEIMLYGAFPLMVSAQCVNKTTGNCLAGDKGYSKTTVNCLAGTKNSDTGINNYTILKDRLGNEFKCVPICRYCYSLIYNNKPLSLLNVKDKVKIINPKYLRLNFVFEDEKDTAKVIDDFVQIYVNNRDISSIDFSSNDYTKGHFLRKTD